MTKIMKMGLILLMLAALLAAGCAAAETAAGPITAEEIGETVTQIRALADQSVLLNDPASPDALSEDGYALQFDFGVIYADRPAWTAETQINAAVIMDSDVAGPRGAAIDWEMNRVLKDLPCDNPEMYGTRQEAVLYLQGEAEGAFRYALAERDGQRISAVEYGAADPETGRKVSLVLGISGDGVNSLRLEGLGEQYTAEQLAEQYKELEELKGRYAYARVPRSLNGAELEMFQEADLDFSALSFLTAVPETFGDNVEDVLMDNEDGTWLRRIDGDGFEAVFSCDSEGKHARILSYEILSPELEGPRCVRLGDLFHEDFTRFRSGEGSLSEDGTKEVLYGTEGTAPWGTAEYGDGTEMTLRYVTATLGGPDVELILRYRDTALAEIILHTVEEE